MEKSINFTLLSANSRQISETNCERAEFNDFPTSSAFFWIFQDQFYVWNVHFRSLIYTGWILFSTLFDHYFAQIRSEFAIMRAEFKDFPTSSAFFLNLSGSILGLKHVLFRSLIYTDWILFSTLFDHYFAQIRSEFAIMRAEFNDFPTSSAFFWIFQDQF